MVFVRAILNTKEMPIGVVDPNVYSIVSVPEIRLVFVVNVRTLVQELVDKVHSVKLSIIFQCAIVRLECLAMLSYNAILLKVRNKCKFPKR